jgi:hypothetical protein
MIRPQRLAAHGERTLMQATRPFEITHVPEQMYVGNPTASVETSDQATVRQTGS